MAGRRFDTKLNNASLATFEKDLIDFARSRHDYYQFRFLDNTGMERIRLDRTPTGLEAQPLTALQNKSGRYYFTRSVDAAQDQIYISHFDLNVEHGQIEIPYKPTLRYVCPVFDSSDRIRGVVALNYNGGPLLNELKAQDASGSGQTMLTTGQGYWILGTTHEDEWGHILKEREDISMAERFPKAWGIIHHNEKGQFLNDQGLFTFDTITIIPGARISETPPTSQEKARRWKIVSWVSPAQLSVPWMSLFIALVALFLVMLAAGCWRLAHDKVRQAEVEANIRENEERTLAIGQSSQDAIAMIDDQDQVTYWNPSAERILGYTAPEILGKRLHETLVPTEQRAQAMEAFANFAATGKGNSVGRVVEFTALHKKGKLVPIELAVSSFQLKGRWYAVGSMRDITRRKQDEADLIRSDETNKALINAPTESAFLIEPDGTVVVANNVAAQKLNIDHASLIGRNIFDLFLPKVAELRRAMIAKVITSGESVQFENSRDNLHFITTFYPSKKPDGTIDRIAIFSRDVTEQHQAKMALMLSEQRFRDVSEAVGEFIWETDTAGCFQFITEDVESVLGYTAAELIGHPPQDFVIKENFEEFKKWRDAAVEDLEAFSNVELECQTKDGQVVWLQISGVAFYDDKGTYAGYRGAAMSITDRKKTEAELTRLATTDSLTGLNNRRRFMESAETEFTRSQRYDRPLSLFIMDIDHFKTVNDTYGHDVGDVVLRALSETTLRALRNADTLGRIGGEEFGAILSETNEEAALEVAERVRTSVEQSRIPTNAGELQITISLGVACLRPDTKDLQELLKRADVALYKAKQSGRNRVSVG